MHVLHVDLGKELRGGQYQALALIEELQRKGISQHFLGPHGDPFSLRALREPASLVHVHDARAHSWAVLFAKAPVVVSRRVAFPVKTGWMSRWKYRRPELFLAVSKFVAGVLMEGGVPASRIEVIYDGVRALPQSTRTGPLIAPATEDPMKGSDLVRRSGIPISFSSNLIEDLKTARGLVYITRQEGLGSAALLAMSAGVPVLASRIGGLPEIVHHGETGLLTENEPDAIAAAALRLDTSEATAWGEEGRRRVQAAFLTCHTADATLAAYRRVVSGAGSAPDA